jgi:hypothetical protein
MKGIATNTSHQNGVLSSAIEMTVAYSANHHLDIVRTFAMHDSHSYSRAENHPKLPCSESVTDAGHRASYQQAT